MQPSRVVRDGIGAPPNGADLQLQIVHRELAEIFGASGGVRGPVSVAYALGRGPFADQSNLRRFGLWLACLIAVVGAGAYGLLGPGHPLPNAKDAVPVRARAAQTVAAHDVPASIRPRITPAPVRNVPAPPPLRDRARAEPAPPAQTRNVVSRHLARDVQPYAASAPAVASSGQPASPSSASLAPETPPACPATYEAWCLRSATLDADQALREAYGSAVRAGVARPTLKAVKHDWVHYRRLARKQPRELIRGYSALTDKLNHLLPQKRAE